MKSIYRRIGDYIQLVDERNTDLKVDVLLGLSISKEFIPSVANTVGTNLANYKIIRKGQFACSLMQVRRDKKIPIALQSEFDAAIISPAYPVFEVKHPEILLPDYLMMWMMRPEFDREACFYAVGGVRGSLEWDDFCDMKLPIPDITKQKAIVNEYNTFTKRIEINNQLIQKLDTTAQTIFQYWFVDFEFPDKNGQPYKSSNGEMEWNDEYSINIPSEWKIKPLGKIADILTGFPFNSDEYSFKTGLNVVRGENVSEKRLRWDQKKKWNSFDLSFEKYLLQAYDIVIGMDGSKVGKNWSIISKNDLPLLLAQRVARVRTNKINWQLYIYISMIVLDFSKYVSIVQTGTSVPHISKSQIEAFQILIPKNEIFELFCNYCQPILDRIILLQYQNNILYDMAETDLNFRMLNS